MTICSPRHPRESSAAVLCGSSTELSAIYKAFGVRDAEGYACRKVSIKGHFSDVGTCDILLANFPMEAKDRRSKHPVEIFVQTCDAVSLEGQGDVHPGDVLVSCTSDYQKACSSNTAERGHGDAIQVANFLASLRRIAHTHGLSTMRESPAEQLACTRVPTYEQGSEGNGASRFLAPTIHLHESIEGEGPGTHSLSIIVQGVFGRVGTCRETAAAGAAKISRVILQLWNDSKEPGTDRASNYSIYSLQRSEYSSHVNSQVSSVTQGNRMTINSDSAAYLSSVCQEGSTFCGTIITVGNVTQGNTMEFI